MGIIYGMQRANGDWFALDDHGESRMPVFHSTREAMVARSRETGMECFRPVRLDSSAIQDLRRTEGNAVHFWIVSDPLVNLKRGQRIDLAEFDLLLNGA